MNVLARKISLLTSLILTIVFAPRVQAQRSHENSTVAEQYLLSAANQERASLGLPPLRHDPLLAQAARQHANEMAAHGTISHQFAGEPDLSTRGAKAGARFSLISENVGEAPSAVQLHDLWMHSSGHRRNLLDPAVDAAGISVVMRDGELYAVEDFAKTVQIQSLEEQESAIGRMVSYENGLTLNRSATPIARETCSMSTGYAGKQRPWFVMRFSSDSLSELPVQLKNRLASGQFRQAAVGACNASAGGPFTSYNIAVLLYP